ncbi:MAG: SpoIVB peptidase [Lachnospiraceae bacterium]|nr:SpoIVB peptidase [Lachnospiraceae bacterium]
MEGSEKVEDTVRRSGYRRSGYRRFLYSLLCLGIVGIIMVGYNLYKSRIPETIKIRVGEEEKFDFNIPASGELYKEALAVSDMGEKEIASIHVELDRPFTMIASEADTYKMELKLFGILPLRDVDIEVIHEQILTPAGIPIGIYVKTEGVLIIGIGEFEGKDGNTYMPAEHLLQTGDYILTLNGEEVKNKKSFRTKIAESNGNTVVLGIRRNEEEFEIKCQPRQSGDGEYKLGIWIRDNAQGVGTMTFVDEENNFGALGHGINDMDTSTLMQLEYGTLYHTDIVGIKKGVSGEPGELTGIIIYDDDNVMGSILDNTVEGIFGICDKTVEENLISEALPVGLKQEVKTGAAQIICSVDGKPAYYDIEIKEVYMDNNNVNRGIVLKITDEKLLALTGGIVQGMSGSPIIQNGRIVGAVTHVLVNDPTRGYGIFIENMLEH